MSDKHLLANNTRIWPSYLDDWNEYQYIVGGDFYTLHFTSNNCSNQICTLPYAVEDAQISLLVTEQTTVSNEGLRGVSVKGSTTI